MKEVEVESKETIAKIKRNQGLPEVPYRVQKYAIPLALSGFDLIGIAATGSWKSIAFLLP